MASWYKTKCSAGVPTSDNSQCRWDIFASINHTHWWLCVWSCYSNNYGYRCPYRRSTTEAAHRWICQNGMLEEEEHQPHQNFRLWSQIACRFSLYLSFWWHLKFACPQFICLHSDRVGMMVHTMRPLIAPTTLSKPAPLWAQKPAAISLCCLWSGTWYFNSAVTFITSTTPHTLL